MEEAAERVAKCLGPGLSEYVYRNALSLELTKIGLRNQCERVFPIFYDDNWVGFVRTDIYLPDSNTVLELKAKATVCVSDHAQAQSYKTHIPGCSVIIINFGYSGLKVVK